MAQEKKKISKGQLRTVIVGIISIVFVVVILILNSFIPVKYLSSYMVTKNAAPSGTMRVRYVDVGYGDCIIVELPDGKNMLIDGGTGTDKNRKRVLKFLNKADIDTIDYLVCTSPRGEHCGSLAEVVKYKSVKRVYMPYCTNEYITDEYSEFCLAVQSSGAECVISEYGTGVSNSEYGYFFGFLSPSNHNEQSSSSEYYQLNTNPTTQTIAASSAVMWLEYAGTSFLFTSHTTSDVLEKIVSAYNLARSEDKEYLTIGGNPIRLENCNVVQVAAHASTIGKYLTFYNTLMPDMAVVSTGTNGEDTLSTDVISDVTYLVKNNIYMTNKLGTITIDVTADGYSVV
jgi:competence protein ComEC